MGSGAGAGVGSGVFFCAALAARRGERRSWVEDILLGELLGEWLLNWGSYENIVGFLSIFLLTKSFYLRFGFGNFLFSVLDFSLFYYRQI